MRLEIQRLGKKHPQNLARKRIFAKDRNRASSQESQSSSMKILKTFRCQFPCSYLAFFGNRPRRCAAGEGLRLADSRLLENFSSDAREPSKFPPPGVPKWDSRLPAAVTATVQRSISLFLQEAASKPALVKALAPIEPKLEKALRPTGGASNRCLSKVIGVFL